MSFSGSYRLLSQIENGTMNAAALQSALANPQTKAEFEAICGTSGLITRVASVSNSMNAVVGSTLAMTAVLANSISDAIVAANPVALPIIAGSTTAMTLVVNDTTMMTGVANNNAAITVAAASSGVMAIIAPNTTAMPIVANSTVAMTACRATSVAKMAFFNNDVALTEILASANAMNLLRAAAGYSLLATAASTSSSRSWPGVTGASYIVLGISQAGSSSFNVNGQVNTRRVGSGRSNTYSNGVNATTALTTSLACPVTGPFTVTTNNSGDATTIYVGALRCDI